MKQIRMLRDVVGAHLGDPGGSRAGDVLDVDDAVAEAYVLYRWADLVEASPSPPRVETAVAQEGETAMAPQPEPSVMKRGPGRPRKE